MKKFKFLYPILFSLVLTACISQNAVSGRNSFNVISPEEEITMGNEAYQQVLSEATVSTDAKDNARLQKVCSRLIATVGNDIPNAEWEFKIFISDEINAFALPGGKVVIYSSLFNMLNDDELAYVLGHEIAHVTCRHGSERVSQQLALQVGAAAIAAALQKGSPQNTNILLAAYGLGTQVGIALPFSRKQELEADKFGSYYSARSGYDPRAGITTLQKFQQMSEGRAEIPEFLRTHPLDKNRIAALETEMPNLLAEYETHKAR